MKGTTCGKSDAPYAPFPVGTVRGPYVCGWGVRAAGGVQFLVRGRGGWVPFVGQSSEEVETRKRAEDSAKEEMT